MTDPRRPSSLRRLLDTFRRPTGPGVVGAPASDEAAQIGPSPVVDASSFGTNKMKDAWRVLELRRGDRPFLTRAEIDPSDLLPVLPLVSLIEVHGRPPRFRYRLVGTGFRDVYGFEATGLWLDAWPDPAQGAVLTATNLAVVDAKRPLFARQTQAVQGRVLRHEGLFVPLSSDGSEIDMLLVIFVALADAQRGAELG